MKRSVSQMGWLRHVLTILAVTIFILGCTIIGYMAWVLASSVTVSRFLEGTLIFTYVVIGFGFTLFFSGLIGWVGGTSESTCLVRLFLMAVVVTILAEVGGIIALSVIRIRFGDIVQSGWDELNQGTRNIVQSKLNCCGWEGPKDFAYNNEPIHESCYERVQVGNSGIWNRRSEEEAAPVKKMKQDGCGEKLHGWFVENKITWVTFLASIVALQIMCCGIAMYILSRVKKMNKLRKSRTISKRRLYDSGSEGSNDYRQRI
ncbi:CD82 antigen-like [Tigriopus californicus]|nr:CD82 antigen-like [Tigriopus californicus]